jgi:FkbM family methyltransferase
MQKYDQALCYEIFEKGEYAFLDRFFSWAKIIVDVGGHKGFFSLYAFSKGFWGKIYFFEPIWENIQEAKKNLKNFSENITFFEKAISHKKWVWEMYFNSEKSMQSSFFTDNFLCKSWGKREVKLFDIHNLWQEEKNKKFIDILKIDIEWYEFELFENMQDDFFENIGIIALEYHEIFEDETRKKERLGKKLEKYFSSVEFLPSKYTPKIWILFAKK